MLQIQIYLSLGRNKRENSSVYSKISKDGGMAFLSSAETGFTLIGCVENMLGLQVAV